MSRIENFIVISFAMLSDGEKVMSCKSKWCICTWLLKPGQVANISYKPFLKNVYRAEVTLVGYQICVS